MEIGPAGSPPCTIDTDETLSVVESEDLSVVL